MGSLFLDMLGGAFYMIIRSCFLPFLQVFLNNNSPPLLQVRPFSFQPSSTYALSLKPMERKKKMGEALITILEME